MWSRADAYDAYMGRWSRLVAREFLKWLAVRPGKRWLEVGSGTGQLSRTILELAAPSALVGIDKTESFVELARAQTNDSRATFRLGDAQDLKTERGEFDVVVSGLVINFVPSPPKMVAEMARACRIYGKVALYVWDYGGGMGMLDNLWDTAMELDPDAKAIREASYANLPSGRALWDLFLDAGMNDVTTRLLTVPTVFKDFDDYWNPFQGVQGSAATYLNGLSEDKRAALREALRKRLSTEADGSIHLTASAWAVKGTR